MDKLDTLPILPYNLKPQKVYYTSFPEKLLIIAWDDTCVYTFAWDGKSSTVTNVNIYMNYKF